MTVEKRSVVVGIRMDSHSRQLLNWALVKVAEPGDSVIAVHVVRSSDYISKNKVVLGGYLEVYEGLCKVKKVGVSGEVLTGNSIRNILVREAKKHGALALVVGTCKQSGQASTAKYCAKRLPPITNVIAIQDGRIVFRSCKNNQLTVTEDPRPSLIRFNSFNDKEFTPELETVKSTCQESIENQHDSVERCKKVSATSQKLGWPLLRRANSGIPHASNISVVQWVMSLPDRSLQKSPFIEPDPPKGFKGILNINSSECKWFSLRVLESWTSQFSSDNLIGKGGSNLVYRGILADGKPVAVKVLKSSKQAWKDFALEVEIISSLKHKNITPLLGVCMEDDSLISVYDYFPKGSLEESLYGKNKDDGSTLSWEVRFDVAVGIAEALNYLRSETLKPVIHRDVKSSNILLSDEFEPHLSDFGLAIWGPSFLTQEDVVGTFGYLAPEYFTYRKVSEKIDVYAFGVVLLELISGRKPISCDTCKGQESLVVWAKQIIESGDVKGILDPNLQGMFDESQMRRMVMAARLCITRASRLRPKMNQVLQILKGYEKVENFLYSNQENVDHKIYPNSSAELHLSLALLEVDDDTEG